MLRANSKLSEFLMLWPKPEPFETLTFVKKMQLGKMKPFYFSCRERAQIPERA